MDWSSFGYRHPFIKFVIEITGGLVAFTAFVAGVAALGIIVGRFFG